MSNVSHWLTFDVDMEDFAAVQWSRFGGFKSQFGGCEADFFTETSVTPERKVEKSFPRWEINRHAKG